MSSKCDFVINGKKIRARLGDTLLNAALVGGVALPHDCNTGQCDTCRVRVYSGNVDDNGTGRRDTVLACQATVIGEAVIEFDEVPEPSKSGARVTSVLKLTPDIFAVSLILDKKLTHLPGQYVKVAFAGFPARDYSPTVPLDGVVDDRTLILHIRVEPDGVVSSDLGRAIREGTRASVHGPFGNSFHRRGDGRIILVSSGTGFAPIWAIARASRFREPQREMIISVGTRRAHNLYMREELKWLASTGVQGITLTCSGPHSDISILSGRPTAHLPPLESSDTIFCAGAPAMVSAVEILADAAGATCYSDAFLPAEPSRPWRQRLASLVRHQFSGTAA